MPIRQAARSLDGSSLAEYVDSVLAASPVTVLDPSPGLLASLTDDVYRDPPISVPVDTPIRVVARPDVLTALYETFQTGHQAGELADRDLIGYRAASPIPTAGPLVVSPGRVGSVVAFGDSYAVVETDRSDLATIGNDRARALWEDADPVSPPDLPTWRDVRLTLTAATDRETARAVTDVLAARRRAKPERTLDVPTVVILAGAATRARQKDLADWCARQTIAAPSTVSDRKQTLEARGLLTTEPVPDTGVGAPIHRLDLADDHLHELDLADLYGVAADVLGEG